MAQLSVNITQAELNLISGMAWAINPNPRPCSCGGELKVLVRDNISEKWVPYCLVCQEATVGK